MKKNIKVKFYGFWPGFDPKNNFMYNILSNHYNVEFSEKPDYLFYSCFCDDYFNYMNYDCIRIFFSGENVSPDFNYCDYSIGFDEIVYNDRHICFPLFLTYSQLNERINKHIPVDGQTFQDKEYFCNFIVGNSEGIDERTEIFNKLNKYKMVSSCGTYLNNTTPIVKNQNEKLTFQQKCRFTISFESVAQPGFVTEKILHAFAAKTVPIYYGNENINTIFNPNSFINCHEYENLDQVVEKIKEIEENPALWEEMIKTPCFNDNNYRNRKWYELEKFICNIIDQDYEKAFRRPLRFRAVRAENIIKRSIKFRSFMRKNSLTYTVLKVIDKLLD